MNSLIGQALKSLKVANFELPYALTHLPLAEQNLAWLIPSLVVFVIAFVIDKVKK
jgi:branched-chain amino acid:cation transporter, LIVCS family